MRVRTRNRPNSSRWYYGTGPVPVTKGWGPGVPNPTTKVKFDYDYYSYMQDAKPSDRTVYQAVYHEHYEPACFSGTVGYTFSPPTDNLFVNVCGLACYIPGSITSSPDWGALLDMLSANLSGRMSKTSMLAVTLKEIGQTYAMFRNPFGLLKRNFRKKVNLLPAHALAKNSANVWLEYLYGWKSFFMDLTSFSEATGRVVVDLMSEERQDEDSQRFCVTQRGAGTLPNAYAGSISSDAQWEHYTKEVPISQTAFSPNIRIRDIQYEWTSHVTCRAHQSGASMGNLTRSMLRNYDVYNWQSFRDVLWEVIPFSFVVDWFINMKSLWAPLNRYIIAQAGARQIGYSTKKSCTYNAEAFCGRWSPTYYSGQWSYKDPTSASSPCIPPVSRGNYTYYQRTAGWPPGTTPVDSFLKSGLSISQLATGAALVAQKFL